MLLPFPDFIPVFCEKDAYEANAKRLITSWGGIQEDYAARFWSGLIKDYYIPRIQLYFTKDRDKIREWEEQWITSPWSNSTTPFDDPVKAALNLTLIPQHFDLTLFVPLPCLVTIYACFELQH